METARTRPEGAEVKSGVTPYLEVKGAYKAAEFYEAAFGAVVVEAMPPDASGRTMHIHLHINGGSLMLADPYPEYNPASGATPQGFNLMMQVPDADVAFKRAVEAGATPIMQPENTFWGARYGQVKDPFGIIWAFNQPL